MSEERSYRRGEVLLVALPFVSAPARSKIRPAVVIQNNVGNRFSPNLIVAAISSQLPPRDYPTNYVVRLSSSEGEGTGLDRDSVVQAEVILTIPKVAVVRHLGYFGATAMRAIDERLRVSLDLQQ